MSIRIEDLRDGKAGYTARTSMEWARLRRHFKAERKRLKLTQMVVAARGNVEQSAISKIESDPTYTAQADTFLSAIEGLGLTIPAFFESLETRHDTGISPSPVKPFGGEPSVDPALSTDPYRAAAVKVGADLVAALTDSLRHMVDSSRAAAAAPPKNAAIRGGRHRRVHQKPDRK